MQLSTLYLATIYPPEATIVPPEAILPPVIEMPQVTTRGVFVIKRPLLLQWPRDLHLNKVAIAFLATAPCPKVIPPSSDGCTFSG